MLGMLAPPPGTSPLQTAAPSKFVSTVLMAAEVIDTDVVDSPGGLSTCLHKKYLLRIHSPLRRNAFRKSHPQEDFVVTYFDKVA